METMVKKDVLHVAARFLEKMLNEDGTDATDATTSCILCSGTAPYGGHHLKTFTIALGDITLDLTYSCCQSCGSGWCPKDYGLGFGNFSFSPGVNRMIAMVASAE